MSLSRVELNILREFSGKVRLSIDRMHWAYIHTGHAINAVLRVNDHLVFHFVEAGDRAHFYTVGESACVTFVGQDVRLGFSAVDVVWQGVSLTLEVFQ